MKVIVYSTPTCGYCHQVKLFLQQRGIKFVEKDVSRDRNAANEMVGRSGQMGVPVIIVDDEVVIGFDRPRLESLLSKAAPPKPASLGIRVTDAAKRTGKAGVATTGAYIQKVHGSSPADRAGLREGDVITQINSQSVANADDVARAISSPAVGARVSMTIIRNGSTLKIDAAI
jgi:glutaredoxin-like YruB-family protein